MQILKMMASIQTTSEYSDFCGKSLRIYSSIICQIALAFPFKWWKMKHPTASPHTQAHIVSLQNLVQPTVCSCELPSVLISQIPWRKRNLQVTISNVDVPDVSWKGMLTCLDSWYKLWVRDCLCLKTPSQNKNIVIVLIPALGPDWCDKLRSLSALLFE